MTQHIGDQLQWLALDTVRGCQMHIIGVSVAVLDLGLQVV